jgi:hypothetical protein
MAAARPRLFDLMTPRCANSRTPGKCPVCRAPVTAEDVRQLYM